jgi:DNA-binding transcriptional LysR family regulator
MQACRQAECSVVADPYLAISEVGGGDEPVAVPPDRPVDDIPTDLSTPPRRGSINSMTSKPAEAQHLRDLVRLRRVRDHIEALLAQDDLDMGIGFMEARSVEIESRAWFVETLTVVVGRGHPYATRRRPLPIREFGKASLVLLSGDFATRGHIDCYCQEQGVKPHIAIEANSVSGIIEIVQHSDRLATVLPGALAHRHEGLCPVRLREAMPQRTEALLQRKAAYRTAACQAFLDMASQWS